MQLTKQELDIIYHCLQDCMNSDDWWFVRNELSETMTKIKKIAKNTKQQ